MLHTADEVMVLLHGWVILRQHRRLGHGACVLCFRRRDRRIGGAAPTGGAGEQIELDLVNVVKHDTFSRGRVVQAPSPTARRFYDVALVFFFLACVHVHDELAMTHRPAPHGARRVENLALGEKWRKAERAHASERASERVCSE